jgi:hypothetical protein
MDAFQGSGAVTPSHTLMEKNLQMINPSQNPSQPGTRPVTKRDFRLYTLAAKNSKIT